MKKLSFVIASLLLTIAGFSQTNTAKRTFASLTGKITDSTGAPLAGASIFLYDIRRGTTTDPSGNYTLGALAQGRYVAEITYSGYRTIVETVSVSGATEQNFTLHASVTEQEGVTVTGVSTATSIRRTPQPVVVLKRSQLVAISSTNIINTLTRIPGVNAVTTGPAISKPFIRGLGYNRVLTINDGVRQEGQQWGDEHGIEIDDYSVQRAEVLKGPASLIYGSDALAGVINLQTQLPVPEGTIHAEVLGEYQSNNRLRGTYGNIAGTKNGFSWGVYGSYKGAEDYKNKYDGYVFNSKFYNKNVGGMLGYSGGWGHSYVLVSNFNQHVGLVEGARDSATGRFIKDLPGGNQAITSGNDFHNLDMQVPYQHIRHFKAVSDNSFNLGRSRLDATVSYQQNQRQEFGDPDAPDAYGLWFNLKTINYSLRLNLPYTGNWKTSIGLNGMHQTNENKGIEFLIPAYNLNDVGGYVFTQYTKGKWSASGGLRYDNRHLDSKSLTENGDQKFKAFTKSFSNVSGSAGITYQASNALTLKLNAARGFRAPALAELATNGAHEGTNRYEVGDNNLKSETSLQGDVGIELNTNHITFGISGFYNHIQNFIFYENVLNRLGSDSILIEPGTGDAFNVFKFSQRSANLYGVEANLDIHPHPLDWLHFENTFSYTHAQFAEAIDGTKNVPLIPAARLLSNLRGNFLPKGKTFRNLYASVESDYTARQNRPFTGFDTETATDDYELINAYLGTDVVGKNGHTIFSIHLSGLNLADVAYQNHLSRLKYADVNYTTGRQGVFNMGRNFGIKVNVPLDFAWK